MCTSRAVTVVALCFGMHLALAQDSAQTTAEPACFRISVDLDDTPVPDSINVYVIRKGHSEKLPQIDGCFRLPASFKASEKVSVRIDVGQDSLSLPGVSPGYLGRPWGIFLSDKTDSVKVGTKRYKASQVCQVIVHHGELQNGFVTAPCRSTRRQLRRH